MSAHFWPFTRWQGLVDPRGRVHADGIKWGIAMWLEARKRAASNYLTVYIYNYIYNPYTIIPCWSWSAWGKHRKITDHSVPFSIHEKADLIAILLADSSRSGELDMSLRSSQARCWTGEVGCFSPVSYIFIRCYFDSVWLRDFMLFNQCSDWCFQIFLSIPWPFYLGATLLK